jgi:small GTP-binding protein
MSKSKEIVLRKIKEAEENHYISLDLSDMNLSTLPKEIGKCNNLRELILWKNKITKLPKEIGNLKNLETLYLSGNKIVQLPIEIGELTNLRELYLAFNQIKEFPIELTYLKRLEKLVLDKNNIRELPFEFSNLNLNFLGLDNNPLIKPPLEIVVQGKYAIRNYFKSLDNSEELFQLKEAKILIVGEGGVGKTCLIRKLIDRNFEIDLNEKTTEGIDIEKWNITESNGTEVKVNIWDFGGQEIYHSTHQFFLTKRSIYIYVWNARTDDDLSLRFEYWLNTIKLLSDNSPLIIVQNKIDERFKYIDVKSLKAIYPNIVGTVNTSSKTGEGLDELTQEIKNQIAELPHLGDVLPKAWLDIRKRVENLDKNYTSYNEYEEICQEYKVTKAKASFLGRYFHDLGVFLSFRNNPVLKTTLFLQPDWATNAVYKIIDTKEVQHNKGMFNYEDLHAIWSDYPEEKFSQLLELMKKFELCFQINDSSEYIIPNLLPPQKPEYAFVDKLNLKFEYHYDFMPSGILSRFIVRAADLIYFDTYWKNGVLIATKGAIAEIISYPFEKRIRVSINGSNKRELLAIIRREVEQIHKSQNYPEVEEMIPCICDECKNNKSPYFHSFRKLVKARAKNKTTIECQNSFDDVSLKELLGIVNESKPIPTHKTIYVKGNYIENNREMEIHNQNIYGGNQQFADKIINHSSNELQEDDREVLKLFFDDIDSVEKRGELVEALNNFKSKKTTPTIKSKAKSILSNFFKAGISESGKLIAKDLIQNGHQYLEMFL